MENEIKEVNKFYGKNEVIIKDINNNTRRCKDCNVEVHRVSYAKHITSKKRTEKEKNFDLNVPEWLFQETIENKNKKMCNPKYIKTSSEKKNKIGW